MSKTLELIFKTSLDKPVKLQLIKFDAVLTEQLVKESMNQILELGILKSNVGKPVKAYSAQIIDKNTTILSKIKIKSHRENCFLLTSTSLMREKESLVMFLLLLYALYIYILKLEN